MAEPFPEQLARSALAAFRIRCREAAREREELRAEAPARVVRLDRAGAYWLVPIRDSVGLRGIVQLDEGGAVAASAAIRDPTAGFLINAAAALAAAKRALPGKRGWGSPYLGWRPCRESFDGMRPLWVIPHSEGNAYVSQGGDVFERLTAGRGG